MVLGQVGEPDPLPAAAGTATEQRRAAISADRNRHAGREQPIEGSPGASSSTSTWSTSSSVAKASTPAADASFVESTRAMTSLAEATTTRLTAASSWPSSRKPSSKLKALHETNALSNPHARSAASLPEPTKEARPTQRPTDEHDAVAWVLRGAAGGVETIGDDRQPGALLKAGQTAKAVVLESTKMRSPSLISAAPRRASQRFRRALRPMRSWNGGLPATVSGSDSAAVGPLQGTLPFECSEVAADGHLGDAELVREVRDAHIPSLKEDPRYSCRRSRALTYTHSSPSSRHQSSVAMRASFGQ